MLTNPFRFRRFQTRVIVFVISLLLLALGGAFYSISKVSRDNARTIIDENLEATARAFQKTLSERKLILLGKARLLSADYAFKQAFAIGEHATLVSALRNQRARLSANMMMVLSMDEEILADTLNPDISGEYIDNTELIDAVMDSDTGEIDSIEKFGDNFYQIVMVPLFTPEPSALIVIGFIINDDFAASLSETTRGTQITLASPDAGQLKIFASTLPEEKQRDFAIDQFSKDDHLSVISLGGSKYISRTVRFDTANRGALAILQESLSEQLKPFQRLYRTLLLIFLLAIFGSILGAILVGRSVVSPVKILEAGARKIEEGKFSHRVEVKQRDELGRLAESFNRMSKGLEEKEKVRNLLGKVVSPQIAEELMKRDIKLGGEEQEVTVLFSDIRDFTTLCENLTPTEVVDMLNTYLTHINDTIEANSGVVDKYIGDAVMALFGAPLKCGNDAENAVLAAMQMLEACKLLNLSFREQGIPELKIGLGINTDVVLTGNMGSESRLNYTVIGDGVNLAARLEGLSKYYGVEIIVSESTSQQADQFIYQELDRVRVKGKNKPVTIFQPICQIAQVTEEITSELQQFTLAMDYYRQQDWDAANAELRVLIDMYPEKALYQLYLSRIDILRESPPKSDWDGVFVHRSK